MELSSGSTSAHDQSIAVGSRPQALTAVDWDPAPTDSGYAVDVKLDKLTYSTKNTSIEVELSNYPWKTDSSDVEPAIVEILRQDTGSVMFYEEVQKNSFSIDVNLHPGEYLLRVRQNMNWDLYFDECWGEYWDEYWNADFPSARFSVTGTSDLIQLTGEAVVDGDIKYPESSSLLGVRLEWDGPSNGGPYTLTRKDKRYFEGKETIIKDVYTNHFIDGDALGGGIYVYTISDGKRNSNPIVVDLSGFPPLEYMGNNNDKVIVLKIGDPHMYSAKDKKSASKPSNLKQMDKIVGGNDPSIVPVIKNGYTLLPMDTLVRTMGGSIAYDDKKQLVTVKLWNNILEISIGSQTVWLNNEERKFDTSAQIEHNHTLVPIRYLGLLGCEIDWVARYRMVVICYQGSESLE